MGSNFDSNLVLNWHYFYCLLAVFESPALYYISFSSSHSCQCVKFSLWTYLSMPLMSMKADYIAEDMGENAPLA